MGDDPATAVAGVHFAEKVRALVRRWRYLVAKRQMDVLDVASHS
jgi:hypothetical protein